MLLLAFVIAASPLYVDPKVAKRLPGTPPLPGGIQGTMFGNVNGLSVFTLSMVFVPPCVSIFLRLAHIGYLRVKEMLGPVDRPRAWVASSAPVRSSGLRVHSSSSPMMASRTLRSSRGSCRSAQARQASTIPSATGSAGAEFWLCVARM